MRCYVRAVNAKHYNAEVLRQWREGAGLSQEALAEKIGVHRITIIRAESGDSASYDLLLRIASEFSRSVTEALHAYPVAPSVRPSAA